MAITDVELSVGLVPGDIKQTAKDLEKSIKDIFDGSAGQPLDASMQRMQQQMSRNTAEAQKLLDKMTELESKQIPTDEYKEIENQIEKDTAALAKLGEKIEQFRDSGKDTDSDTFRRMEIQADELRNSIEYANGELKDLVDTGKAFTLGSDTQEYENLSNKLSDVNNKNRILINSWDQHKKKLDETSESAKKLDNSYKGLNINLGQGIKKLLKYGLGIASVSVLFNKFRAAATEGIKSLVQWEGQNGRLNKSISNLQSSIATLKNNIGALVEPLINVLAPVLTKIIDLISVAVQKIAMFIAMLTGAKTIKVADKVQSNYAASLDKTAKGAKKAEKALKGYLSPLDEINKFESQKDDDTNAGGGGGAGGPSFSEVPIDPNMFKWLDKLQSLIDYLKKLWGKFKEGFFDGLGDWKSRVDNIKSNLALIRDALIDIWTDPRVIAAADEWAQSLAYMLGSLAGSVASIGLTIAQNLIGGIAKYLDQNRERIKQHLISMFDIWTDINNQLASFFQAFAYVFEAFGDENGQRVTAALIGIFADAFMGIGELVSKNARDLVQLITQPFIDNKEGFREAIDGFLGAVATGLETVKQLVDDVVDTVNEGYDEYIKPVVDDITQDISDFVGKVLEWWNTDVNPLLQDIAGEVKKGYEQYIKPVIQELKPLILDIANFIREVWNTKVMPVLDFIQKNILPIITFVLKAVKSNVQNEMKYIAEILHNIIKVLRGIIQFIKGVFTGDWEAAWEGVKQVFFGIMNGIIAIAERAINKVIDIINGFSIDIPWDWAKSALGTDHVGFNISHVSIPRLAQGAVIPPNKQFMAVLGDQKSGTNIETPLETMIDAFSEALHQNGGSSGRTEINFILPDRRRLAQYVVEGGRIIQTSTGKSPFDLA